MGDGRPALPARMRELSGTVRVRTAAAATIVVGAALVVAAVAMVALLRRSLTADVRASALMRAEVVTRGLVAGEQDRGMPGGDEGDEYVQVVDPDGNVVASSENMRGRPVVVRLTPGETRRIGGTPLEDDPFLVVAFPARTAKETFTVIVGRTLEDVTESTQAVTGLLAVGVPLLLLVVGLVAWRVVGRALAPVEAIRAEVEAISTKELHRRVPDPPGKDEIARLTATMNRMLARLERGHIRQRRFVSDASHEMRSPVATIRQHAEVALFHPDGTSIEEFAVIVLEEDVRLQRLVEDLLVLTKMDEGTLRVRTDSVDLDDLLFEEAERLRGSTPVRVDTHGVSAGRVSGDRGQLDKLVRNLIDNAARHSRGEVALALREDEWE
ncbi:MAG: HAMP domain-containing histidine kinase, partial [Actinomycetota bacterium]|nr:HAMP domain-containing histidine kinase [Actinomycetota bacterium]